MPKDSEYTRKYLRSGRTLERGNVVSAWEPIEKVAPEDFIGIGGQLVDRNAWQAAAERAEREAREEDERRRHEQNYGKKGGWFSNK